MKLQTLVLSLLTFMSTLSFDLVQAATLTENESIEWVGIEIEDPSFEEDMEGLHQIAEKMSSGEISLEAGAGSTCASYQGHASWYGPGFHGRLTASGQRFNQNALTAAHKTLPLGTRVRVTNKQNGRSVVVVVNDRGPYVRGRILDLSKGAANQIGLVSAGTGSVKIDTCVGG